MFTISQKYLHLSICLRKNWDETCLHFSKHVYKCKHFPRNVNIWKSGFKVAKNVYNREKMYTRVNMLSNRKSRCNMSLAVFTRPGILNNFKTKRHWPEHPKSNEVPLCFSQGRLSQLCDHSHHTRQVGMCQDITVRLLHSHSHHMSNRVIINRNEVIMLFSKSSAYLSQSSPVFLSHHLLSSREVKI